MRIVIFLLIFFILGCSTAQTGQSHPFSVYDMLATERISELSISPDGKSIVFTLGKTDIPANNHQTDIWLINTDGTQLRQLTINPSNDYNPHFSPDGKSIFFISGRTNPSQVWKIDLESNQIRQITNQPLDISSLTISPDGEHIAFSMEVFPQTSSPAQTKQILDQNQQRLSSGMIFDSLFVRYWDSWEDGRRSHLFVMPAAGGSAIDLMASMEADTPPKTFSGIEVFTFTPDSSGVVFTTRNVGSQEAWSTNFDIYHAPIDGSQSPECLTESNKAWDANPVFSPDGKTLAYLAMEHPGYESDRFRIILLDWPSGKSRTLTENWDRSPSEICFSDNGSVIYATAANLGQKSLFAIDVKTGDVETIVKNGTVNSPAASNDKVFFTLDNLESAAEIYSINPNGGDIEQITKINTQKLAEIQTGQYEQFTFAGWNDESVYCYIVKPVDFDSDRKYPVAVLIHGGPQGSFGNIFHYRWNAQAFAGAGYAVVMVDFHGSTGYGQQFTDSVRGDWGGKPLEDLQKGLSAALERYSWMDGERVGALGASYGGYMVYLIAGVWPDRFRCLVSHDGTLDNRMGYYETETLWFPEWDFFGTQWENPQSYEKQNPINFIENWKTPTLVIHSALDFRIVDTQGLAAFTALQRRGIPSKLLYFPDESHWVLKPANSIQWHETVIAWLDQWLK